MLVAMLGPFRVHDSRGEPVDPGGNRVRTLLARLALDVNRDVPVRTLIDDLWGESPPTGATNALHTLVSRSRRALSPVTGLRLCSEGVGYALRADPDEIDLHRFERLAARGRSALREDRPTEAVEDLRAALELWRGDPLVDFRGAAFAEVTVTRLERLGRSALIDRIEAQLRLGDHVDLLDELARLTRAHPLDERLAELHIRALRAAGQRAEAVACYGRLRGQLVEHLGTEPGDRLRELHLAVLRDGNADETNSPQIPDSAQHGSSASGPTGGTTPTGAAPPRPMSGFVGRERELAQLEHALREARLVTLFGPGGSGKTRLATEGASRITTQRVLFVELAPVRDGHALSSAVLTGLGVRQAPRIDHGQPGDDSLPRLVETLASEPTLLILDNCEHLVTPAAQLAEQLLSRAPELRILATSREPLALPGEKLLPVGPLELPDDAEAAGSSAAVRLFEQRAVAARRDFELTRDNTAHVVEICRELDGMPLAIELAAARVRSMSPRGVAERLDDRFRLLTRGNRSAMSRHRTLRAVVEWSWELLTEPERVLARRMSVFAGSARAESVAEVCSGAGLEAGDVDEVLADLVDKSLVEAVDDGTVMRYRMLETVRVFCAERLADAGETATLGRRHAEHFLALAEKAAPLIHSREQLKWLARLDAEHDNTMRALRWALANSDAEVGIRLAAALNWYWSMNTRHPELTERMRQVAALGGPAPEESRAVVELVRRLFVDAHDWSERLGAALERLRETDAMSRYVYLGLLEPMVWLLTERLDEMAGSLRRAAEHPDPWPNAAAHYGRAMLAERRGEMNAGEQHANRAAVAFEAIGDRWGMAQAICITAVFHSLRGDHEKAVESLAESVAVLREFRSPAELVPQLARIGMQRVRMGDLAGARAELDEASRLAGSAPSTHRVTVTYGRMELARAEGDIGSARRLMHHAEADLVAIGSPPHPMMRDLLLSFRLRLLLDEGDVRGARELFGTALGGEEIVLGRPMSAVLTEQLARLLLHEAEPEEAARMLGVAAALQGVLDQGDPDVREVCTRLRERLGAEEFERLRASRAELSVVECHAELRRVLGG
ncbi:Predicted ATPase [Actinopolyspora xinjiangensis]|uniref:Predicted ATPase n=1 Tax=Actinopolyspora xinjiangensis TaxID=405564 RepID=A0A1H0WYJ9_9ACTN|nr:BTAD domain-containing putative transcriptional regulator [Actinopolyspora xinjiangensis]SDP95515.1 Predicted ATPase [Actinopolyspora xinjiangensis]